MIINISTQCIVLKNCMYDVYQNIMFIFFNFKDVLLVAIFYVLKMIYLKFILFVCILLFYQYMYEFYN